MGWISNLYETYEVCSSFVGEEIDGKMLLPVAHSTAQAQIEVALSLEGKLLQATIISKEDAKTIIPVTEDSGSRGNCIAPHPLHDKLIYVARDYKEYLDKAKCEEYYESYIMALEKWSNSSYSHPTVKAIYQYLNECDLIHDLVQLGIFTLENGRLSSKEKIQGIAQSDVFIRFRVEDAYTKIELPWKDKKLFQQYVNYFLSLARKKDICYITGKSIPCSDKHPSKIRNVADKAKLISANDEAGFTYKGRFANKEQAISIGYKTSQEAHCALRWLIEKQGCRIGEKAIVVWESRRYQKVVDLFTDLLGEEPEEEQVTTNTAYAKKVNSAIRGYETDLTTNHNVVILAVDAATTGRLSVTYYREMNGSEYLERIKRWYSTCFWRRTIWNKVLNKYEYFIRTPLLKEIVVAAYGIEQGGFLKVKDEFMKNEVERLIPCIVDNAVIPADIVNATVQRSLSPSTMSFSNWRFVMEVCCALVKKQRERKYPKEVWNVEGIENPQSDEYLCGRILAVMDAIEGWALNTTDQNRPTNAIKYFNQYAKNPGKVMSTLRKNLSPYIEKFGHNGNWLIDELTDLTAQLTEEKLMKLRNMGGRFILGYECQRKSIRDEIERRTVLRKNVKKEEEK